MELMDLLRDVVNNAPVDRAGNWLLQAAEDYPDLFKAITENLNEKPEVVIDKLAQAYPLAVALKFTPSAREWIANLQTFFKNHY